MKFIIKVIKKCAKAIAEAFVEFWIMISEFFKNHKKEVKYHIIACLIIAAIYLVLLFALPFHLFLGYFSVFPFAAIGYIVFMVRKYCIAEPKPGDKSYYYGTPITRKPGLLFIVWVFFIASVALCGAICATIEYFTRT